MRFLAAAAILTLFFSASVIADDEADAPRPAPVVVEIELGTASLMGAYLAGVPYKVSVEAYNTMEEPVQSPAIFLSVSGDKPIPVKESDDTLPPVINATTRIRKSFTITFPEDAAVSGVPLVGKVSYEWKGVKQNAECLLNVPVTAAMEANVMPRRALASETGQIGVSVINHTQSDRKVTLSFRSPEGIKLQPETAEMDITASGLDAKVFSVSADPALPTGAHEVKLLIDGKEATSFVLDVPGAEEDKSSACCEK